MSGQERLVSRIKNNDTFRNTAAAAAGAAALTVAARFGGPIAEHKDQITDTAFWAGGLGITWALMSRTLESAWKPEKVGGWLSFTVAAAVVAEHIINNWS